MENTLNILPAVETMPESVTEVKAIEYLQKWILTIAKPQKHLNQFAVCPYARFAKYQIEFKSISDLSPIEGVEVAIFVIEDDLSLLDLINKCKELNQLYTDHIFLDDHKDDHTFINGIQTNNGKYNLILCQNKEQLLQKRKNLKEQTNYYSFWDQKLYRKIIEG